MADDLYPTPGDPYQMYPLPDPDMRLSSQIYRVWLDMGEPLGAATWTGVNLALVGTLVHSMEQQILRLEKRLHETRIAELEKALAFYAAPESYDFPPWKAPPVFHDKGQRAREALKETT